MRRRDFIKGIFGSATAWPLAARAQQATTLGFLHAGTADGYAREVVAFKQGLREVGYLEGQNIAIEYRFADGHYDRLPDLAADLVRKSVAVIVSPTFPAALAAKNTTRAIPIVFEMGADPVRLGLVASLNRPGGNITGIVNLSNTLVAKRIELMQQLVPGTTTIALLADPGARNSEAYINDAKTAGTLLGVQIKVLQATKLNEIEAAFAGVVELQAGALVVAADPVFTSYSQQIVVLANRYSVPTSYANREFATAGGLLSYGSDLADAYRLTGVYAGRVLHGDKPADLPVQQAVKVEMVINLKTAKALGITVPLPLLGRADEVIE
jgi:putative tryptophan/tyrosine transport system substrate-binding protein